MLNRHRPWGQLYIAAIVACATLCVSSTADAGVNWIIEESPTPLAFEDPDNWTSTDYAGYVAAGDAGYAVPPNPPGLELMPPGEDSTWFIEGSRENPATNYVETVYNGYDGVVTLTSPRDGINGPKLGAGSIGGGYSDEVTTLIISTDVTITGLERDNMGLVKTDTREFRVGQQDWANDDVFPWGIVKQTSGMFHGEYATNPADSDIKMSADKTVSAGSIWEVGGDASLLLHGDVQMSDKANVRAPGSIFRVRGSDVGSISIGVGSELANTGRFRVFSQTASWNVSQPAEYGGRVQLNRGKSIVEFVLDDGGVTPIQVGDQLQLGASTFVTPEGGGPNIEAYMLAFLRIKLSQPTTAGSGAVGSGNELVLFQADRITPGEVTTLSGTEFDEGRFFDPDRDEPGVRPHRTLYEGETVIADYAGAQYSWTINYFDDVTPPNGDGVVEDAVVLSNLVITGTQGDLNGDAILNESDRTALMNAIANPPTLEIGGKQNLFDLNADDLVNDFDLTAFNTYFLPLAGLAGDFNNDGMVDAADYTVWRDNENTNNALPNDNNLGTPIGPDHYSLWKTNFGMGGGGAGAIASVPEPSSVLMALLCVAGVVGLRRRAA